MNHSATIILTGCAGAILLVNALDNTPNPDPDLVARMHSQMDKILQCATGMRQARMRTVCGGGLKQIRLALYRLDTKWSDTDQPPPRFEEDYQQLFTFRDEATEPD